VVVEPAAKRKVLARSILSLARSGPDSGLAFFVALPAENFAELPEIRLDGQTGPTSGWGRPFKIF
jgi:hypothetical protein